MAERRPGDHLAHGLEELMRAAADGLAIWRERSEQSPGAPGADSLEGAAALLLRALDRDPRPWLELLAEAVRGEIERWERRAASDPAAGRVRDMFASLLDILEGERGGERPQPTAARRPPPRSALR